MVVFLLRLHVLRFIMKIFTCLALWLGRHCYYLFMCASSGTRRAIEGISMRIDVTQRVVGLMSVDQVRRVSIGNGNFAGTR